MKHLGVVVFIIGVLITILYIFKDELFFKQVKTLGHNSSSSLILNLPTENKVKKEKEVVLEENKPISANSTNISISKKNNNDENLNLPKELKGKVVSLEVKNDEIKLTLTSENRNIVAYMKYDNDILNLLEDAKVYNLPLIFVIKKEDDKVYIEDIK